eukprot:scaffold3437_cov113-Cylindrotheca_fusiformis.AAC.35
MDCEQSKRPHVRGGRIVLTQGGHLGIAEVLQASMLVLVRVLTQTVEEQDKIGEYLSSTTCMFICSIVLHCSLKIPKSAPSWDVVL